MFFPAEILSVWTFTGHKKLLNYYGRRRFIFAFTFRELLRAQKWHTSALNMKVPKPMDAKARRHVSELRETLLTQQWCFWNKSPKSLCIILLDSCPDTAGVHSKQQAATRTKLRNGNSFWRMRGLLLEAKHWITQHNRVSQVWTKHCRNMFKQLETLCRNGQKNKQNLVFFIQ